MVVVLEVLVVLIFVFCFDISEFLGCFGFFVRFWCLNEGEYRIDIGGSGVVFFRFFGKII